MWGQAKLARYSFMAQPRLTPSPNYLLLTIPPSLSLKLPLLFSQLEGPAGGSLLMKDLSNNYDWLDPLTGPWHPLGSG
jgi:hypothetical protein